MSTRLGFILFFISLTIHNTGAQYGYQQQRYPVGQQPQTYGNNPYQPQRSQSGYQLQQQRSVINESILLIDFIVDIYKSSGI